MESSRSRLGGVVVLMLAATGFAGAPDPGGQRGDASRESVDLRTDAPSAAVSSITTEILNLGFTIVPNSEAIAQSSLKSSYHGTLFGAMTSMPTFGPDRVTYPSGVGQIPSPGGNTGRVFDDGVIGIDVDNGDLRIAVAGGMNPNDWPLPVGGNIEFGPGDLFLAVDNNGTIEHYALLNFLDGDENAGGPVTGHSTHFDNAISFRYGGPASVGELVKLTAESDILRTGQSRAYTYPGPDGLDTRFAAQGGTPHGVGSVAVMSMAADQPLGSGGPMTWYITEWTVPLSAFGIIGAFDIALHATMNCGNDQTNGLITVTFNNPPECDAGGPYDVSCNGETTKLIVDGSGSTDPDGLPLTYSWSSDCPGADFDDATGETASLTVSTSPGCNVSCSVTLAVTDSVGDTIDCSTSVTVTDNANPVLNGVPTNASVECDAVPAPAAVSATDACDTDVDVAFAEVRTDGSCDDQYSLTRTWTATDDCDNAIDDSQTLTVDDSTSPTFDACPGDIVIDCAPDPGQEVSYDIPTASDNCDGDVTVTCDPPPGSFFNSDVKPLSTTVTCTAEDNCGNTTDSCSFDVTLVTCGACCNFNGSCDDDTLKNDCEADKGHVWVIDTSCEEASCETIPTVSEWGLVVMTLLGCTVGTVLFRTRRQATA